MFLAANAKLLLAAFLLFATFSLLAKAPAAAQSRPTRVAVIGFGNSETARRVTQDLRQLIQNPNNPTEFVSTDLDQTKAAATGAGYTGSLNLTLEEARNLGAAIGSDLFFTGVADTIRRSPSEAASYFESYASLFLVSARTGRLVFWERQEFRRPTAADAERALLTSLTATSTRKRLQDTIRRVVEEERQVRATAVERSAPVIDLMPDDQSNSGLRVPRPFRRPKPPYPDAAAHDAVEAIVDVLVDIDAKGKIGEIQIVRWAGYGLDESVINTVKKMDFFPAMRDGVAIPMRVLLRYNFRKPPPE